MMTCCTGMTGLCFFCWRHYVVLIMQHIDHRSARESLLKEILQLVHIHGTHLQPKLIEHLSLDHNYAPIVLCKRVLHQVCDAGDMWVLQFLNILTNLTIQESNWTHALCRFHTPHSSKDNDAKTLRVFTDLPKAKRVCHKTNIFP